MEFYRKRIGITNVYVLKAKEGYILVDVGTKLSQKKLLKFLSQSKIDPQAIKLIIITHGHSDHIGGLKKFQKFTEAQILAHKAAKSALVEGKNEEVKTTVGKFLDFFLIFTPWFIDRFEAIKPDILISETEYSLDEYGAKALILHTPGHTRGSISVLDEEGNAFVGDLVKGRPYKLFPGMPTIGISKKQIKESWQLLIEKGAKRIHMAHGKPLSVDVLKKRLEKSM